MPRRRPGALRAQHHGPRIWEDPPPSRIHGLSAFTSLAIHRVERLSGDYYVFPGATVLALRRYEGFLQPSGRRPLYPQDAHCSCRGCSFDDVRHARDVLEEVLQQLPFRSRAELKRQVASLDAVYLERTLPDPFADRRQWRADLWWRRRLTVGGEAM
ncbi:hypothetical protein SAMN02787118_15033 [Streptomyces mirabilis]|uniref:Uncharacterized protein n=1 Tax=Streptomyces mirabilis TaxID=68239 RepID=A0A1I2XQ75_9ACTN|nr:hypothetical protein SAMN02787118_15033 [Streptomyces mirabilis]